MLDWTAQRLGKPEKVQSDFSDTLRRPGGDEPGMYTGGSGTSDDSPVVIKATDSMSGILAEYAWVQGRFGKINSDWKLVLRSHGAVGNRHLEKFDIQTSDGRKHTIFFDITSFYGKP